MGPKTLDHVSELLSAYVDGQVSLAERQLVDEHLPGCAECQSELAELRELKAMLAGLPKRPPPRSFPVGPRPLRPAAMSGTLGGFARALTSVAAAFAVVAVGLSIAAQGPPRQSPALARPTATTAKAAATEVRA